MSGSTIKFVSVFVLLSLLLGSCIEFKQMSLYSGEEASVPLAKPDNINQLVEPEIFDEDFTDVWGIETTSCKVASISEGIKAEGKRAIKIEWDRNSPDCIWAGFGIGWDGYAGKDLSELIPFAAIQFQVRTVKGRMFGLPIVLTLEDYSGGMGFSYTGNKYFERTFIDEEWQSVTVPLSSFDMEIENLDPSNIKQLMFELQQGGGLYIDDINLVMYEEKVVAPWYVEEERADPTRFPVTLFDDAFINNNGWGLMKDECRDIKIMAEGSNKAIHAKWNDQKECGALQMGISWNRWFPTDLTGVSAGAQLQLSLKPVAGVATGNVLVQFQDYSGAISKGQTISVSDAAAVSIPVAKLTEGLDIKTIKQVLFTFQGEGNAKLDDIKLVVVTP
ncbi:MAG: hypothetical protein AB8F78_16175 [Saprospiraceae bacterium]